MQDSQLVIEKYKSGFFPPNDIPFEDLSNGDSGSGNSVASPVVRSGTVGAGRGKKRTGIGGIFGRTKVL